MIQYCKIFGTSFKMYKTRGNIKLKNQTKLSFTIILAFYNVKF